MKKDLFWAKTLMSIYRYLERICGSIDKIINKTALSSINVNRQTFYFNNVYSITNKIINLSGRKVTLINLKILIESVFKKMKNSGAEILIVRYVDGEKIAAIAEQKQLSVRTIFRKIEKAEDLFSKLLLSMGYDSEKLEKMLETEAWIKNVYERFLQKNQEDFVLSKYYIEKVASI